MVYHIRGSFFFFKQKTAYELRISDWSSDVCSSDLRCGGVGGAIARRLRRALRAAVALLSAILRRGLSRRRHRRRAGHARKDGLKQGGGIMRHYLAAALLCAAVGGFGAASAQTTGATQTTPSLPEDLNVLFWSQDQRDAAFRTMETIPKVVVHTIEAGGSAFPLAEGKPIDLGVDVDAYMDEQRNAGLIIIQDGQIRLETYKLGYGPEGRWTSFSVAKKIGRAHV